MTAIGTIDAINLNVGDSIFILVNARTTSTTSQTFQINCAIPFACTSISTIPSCGTPTIFAPASGLLGDPNYPAATVCGGTTTQGGLENIYKFIAPTTGTYQFNVNSVANSNSVEYGYKTSAPCNWTGWNCLGAMIAVGQIDTINLNMGDSIFILVNARTTSTTSQTFQINCGTTDIIYNQTQPNLFSLYPNPFSTETTLQTDQFLKDAILTVYNSFGQQVKQIKNISGQTIIFQRDNLPSGLYFVRLTEDNKVIKVDKLVITD